MEDISMPQSILQVVSANIPHFFKNGEICPILLRGRVWF